MSDLLLPVTNATVKNTVAIFRWCLVNIVETQIQGILVRNALISSDIHLHFILCVYNFI